MENKTLIGSYLAKHYKKLWFIFLLAILMTGLFHLLSYVSFMQDLEDKTVDYRFRLSPRPAKADSNIVLLAIDDKTLKFAQDYKQGWPFPREFYALITRYLDSQGAKAVIFDMQFYEPDFDRGDINSVESDDDFSLSMQEAGNVYIGAQLVPDKSFVPEHLIDQSLGVEKGEEFALQNWDGIIPPLEMFATSAAGIGIINVGEGREAIVRRMPLINQLQKRYYPNLALCTWMRHTGNMERISYSKNHLVIDTLQIPMDTKGNFIINWYGKGDAGGCFKYYSFASALQSAVATIYESGDPVLPDGLFHDKFVIIGAKAAGLMDLKSTPYTWSVPGMEIWATILSNLNKQDFVTAADSRINLFITFMIVFLTMLVMTRLRSGSATVTLVLMLILLFAGSALVFAWQRYLVSLTIPVFSLVITWIFIVTVSYMMEGRHKKELRMVFSRYIHPDLVQRIVDNPDMVQMGGNEYQATVMFSDIYNFTGFSEHKSPTELVSYLNEYFRSFTNSILDYNGLLDKYTGDGLMAVFGVPIARDDHALSACRAALAHRDFSLKFKDKADLTPSEQFHLNTRLGIHSGTIVAGNIGSERRMEYTSIGDTVNLSARLEGVNKVFRTYIIVSEATHNLVKDYMVCRELDFLRVKGKKEPTRIFELIAEKPAGYESVITYKNAEYSWISVYENALQQYREGNWQEAENGFQTLAESPQNDIASQTMLTRCRYLMENPPENWDGILTLEEK